MIVTIEKSTAFGEIAAPPSKSMAHRYLICGALSEKSEIGNVDFSEDIKATLGCLEGLGAKVEVNSGTVKIGGIGKSEKINSNKLFCNESGSTLRFLIPLCMLKGEEITLSGTKRLFQRPLNVYEEMCTSQGIKFSQNDSSVTVNGVIFLLIFSNLQFVSAEETSIVDVEETTISEEISEVDDTITEEVADIPLEGIFQASL